MLAKCELSYFPPDPSLFNPNDPQPNTRDAIARVRGRYYLYLDQVDQVLNDHAYLSRTNPRYRPFVARQEVLAALKASQPPSYTAIERVAYEVVVLRRALLSLSTPDLEKERHYVSIRHSV